LNNYKMVSSTSNSDYYDKFLWWNISKADPVLKHDPTNLHGITSRSAQRWFGFSPLTMITQTFKYEFGLSADALTLWEDERIDETGVLTFTTGPLAEDLEITGPLKLTFWASTEFNDPMTQAKIDQTLATIRNEFDIEGNENMLVNLAEREDVQWVVEVNDVFPMGRAKNITSGWLSAAHRPYNPANPTKTDPAYTDFDPFYNYSDKNPDTISENTIYEYVVEIWPTSNVFKKGHRIRVSISASDFPHLFPVLTPSKNIIVLDENHQARLDFKVVNKNNEGVTWKWIDDIGDHLLTEGN
jgi:predicted acyl esterase